MNDDELIEYHFDDEMDASHRQRIAARLQHEPELARRYRALIADLDGLGTDTSAPRHSVQQWHDSIDRAATLEQQTKSAPTTGFLNAQWLGAVAAALVVGIAMGLFLRGGPDDAIGPTDGLPVVVSVETAPVPARNRSGSFTRGVQVYLRDTEQTLTQLALHENGERDQLVADIIQQNRRFERAAEDNNAEDIARVLRAFEPILMRMADGDLPPQDSEELRAQLAFQLNVMLTKLTRDASKQSTST